jgi:hypothetical protein
MTKKALVALVMLVIRAGLAPGQTASPLSAEPVPASIAPHPGWEGCTTVAAAPTVDCGEEEAAPCRRWLGADYLLWSIKTERYVAPLLATTGSMSAFTPGALAQPGTVPALGGAHLDYGDFSGFRLTAGRWLTPDDQRLGVEVSGFLLPERTIHHEVHVDAADGQVLARPLNLVPANIDVNEKSFVIAFPGRVSGSATLTSDSRLGGAEANALGCVYHSCCYPLTVTVLGGFRYLDLDEHLEVSTFSDDFSGFLCSPRVPGASEPPGSMQTVTDSFHARDQFYGGQLGFRAEYTAGRWYVDVSGKLALGGTHQVAEVAGTTVQTQPGLPPTVFGVGVLAGPSNSGHFTHDRFTLVPEGEVRVGYQPGRGFRAFLGYDLVAWSEAVRPANEISRGTDLANLPNVDPRAVPAGTEVTHNTQGRLVRTCAFIPGFRGTEPEPPRFTSDSFWAQGLTVGLELRY